MNIDLSMDIFLLLFLSHFKFNLILSCFILFNLGSLSSLFYFIFSILFYFNFLKFFQNFILILILIIFCLFFILFYFITFSNKKILFLRRTNKRCQT